ncbi:MAG TPA: RAMP superfamily CRISPR-associated protein, partial [Lamprocystis sp. (in: g-proteobacteria)]|nr:RAMP superfamily CRISPR-associated protein [Lamprocystis sp. (in: g-proteobacteria)]
MAETTQGQGTQSQRYRLVVTLAEDLHTGTGTGSGVVDALQARDRAGRPVVWWSHLKGLLLAAAEDLMENDRATLEQVRALFGGEGDSRAGSLRGHSLYLDSAAAQDRPRTLVWSSTALRPGTRLPLEDTLRSCEVVAATNRFATELRLPSDPRLKLDDLLQRCVKRMDALGLGRNRGQGRVLTELTPIKSTGESAADRLKFAERVFPKSDGEAAAGSHRLRLLLRNLDPLSLPSTGYPGNIIPTESFIRGQTLFGALAHWARGDAEAERLLFAGGVQSVGDAFPLPAGCQAPTPAQPQAWSGWDVLPIPLYIKTPKPQGDATDWPWWFGKGSGRNHLGARREVDELAETLRRDCGAQNSPDTADPPEKRKRPKDHEYLFRTAADAVWVRYAPTVGVHLRNQTRDAKEPKGRLFSMDEIAEDTLFLATLSFANAQAARDFAQRFAPVLAQRDWLAVGRGGRPVEVVACQGEGPLIPTGKAAQPDQAPLTLTLTSDLIARDLGRPGQPPSLGFFDRLDPSVLADLTGGESLRTLDARRW